MTGTFLLPLLTLLPSLALAQDHISAVHIDPGTGRVEVLGDAFTTDAGVWITLDGSEVPLEVDAVSSDTIQAHVPADVSLPLKPGTYRLVAGAITPKGFWSWSDDMDVTVTKAPARSPFGLVGWDAHEAYLEGTTPQIACSFDVETKSRPKDEVVLIHATVTGYPLSPVSASISAWPVVERDGVVTPAGIGDQASMYPGIGGTMNLLGMHTLAACPNGCRDTIGVMFKGTSATRTFTRCQVAPVVMQAEVAGR